MEEDYILTSSEVSRQGTAGRATGSRILRDIGAMLDRDECPLVGLNGQVMPEPGPLREQSGQGASIDAHEPERRAHGPAARQGQGSSPGGAAEAAAEALFVGHSDLGDRNQRDVAEAVLAYPSLRMRIAPPVAWLLTVNTPVVGLPARAHMITVFSLDRSSLAGQERSAAAWAWWDVGVRVGPRHTNFGDGSICSFEPTHHTWTAADDLLTLLDLNSLWIARHLFLQQFGRWPGNQVLHTAHERVVEHRPGEFCGCGSMILYDDCHRSEDQRISPYLRMMEFRRRVTDPTRTVSTEVWQELAWLRRQPPLWETLPR